MTIPAAVRPELDQTHEWWDRQYDALVKARIPRDAEYHREHDIEEPIQFWSGNYATKPWCIDCGIQFMRAPDG